MDKKYGPASRTETMAVRRSESVLKTCISEVRKSYDYVLVDCMLCLGMLTINALAADSVVTQPHSKCIVD